MEDYVTACPKCGSTDVSAEKNPAYVATGLFFSFRQCNNCDHHGQVFPEIPRSEVQEKPKPVKEIRERQLVETSYGKGYYRLFVPVIIISVILYVLYILSNQAG